jgi:hypothetical protein
MTDGKIYRLITVGLWFGFCAGLLWSAFLFGEVWAGVPDRFFMRSLLFDENAAVVVLFWSYPLMLGVQYVFEGEVKWLPWQRKTVKN